MAQIKVGDGEMYSYTTDSSSPVTQGEEYVSWIPKITKPASKLEIATTGIKIRLRRSSNDGTDLVVAKSLIGDGSALFEYENQWVLVSGDMFNRDHVPVGSYSAYLKYRPIGTSPDFSYETPRRNDEPAMESVEEGHDPVVSSRFDSEPSVGFLEVQYVRVTHLKDLGKCF